MRRRCKKFLLRRVKDSVFNTEPSRRSQRSDSSGRFSAIQRRSFAAVLGRAAAKLKKNEERDSEIGDLRLRVTFYSVPTGGGGKPTADLIIRQRCLRFAQSSHIVTETQQQVGNTIQKTPTPSSGPSRTKRIIIPSSFPLAEKQEKSVSELSLSCFGMMVKKNNNFILMFFVVFF